MEILWVPTHNKTQSNRNYCMYYNHPAILSNWQNNCLSYYWPLSLKMCGFCYGLYYNALLSTTHSISQVAFPHDNSHSSRTTMCLFSTCLHGIESVILMLKLSSNCCQETSYFGIHIKIYVWVVRHPRQLHVLSWLSRHLYGFFFA